MRHAPWYWYQKSCKQTPWKHSSKTTFYLANRRGGWQPQVFPLLLNNAGGDPTCTLSRASHKNAVPVPRMDSGARRSLRDHGTQTPPPRTSGRGSACRDRTCRGVRDAEHQRKFAVYERRRTAAHRATMKQHAATSRRRTAGIITTKQGGGQQLRRAATPTLAAPTTSAPTEAPTTSAPAPPRV